MLKTQAHFYRVRELRERRNWPRNWPTSSAGMMRHDGRDTHYSAVGRVRRAMYPIACAGSCHEPQCLRRHPQRFKPCVASLGLSAYSFTGVDLSWMGSQTTPSRSIHAWSPKYAVQHRFEVRSLRHYWCLRRTRCWWPWRTSCVSAKFPDQVQTISVVLPACPPAIRAGLAKIRRRNDSSPLDKHGYRSQSDVRFTPESRHCICTQFRTQTGWPILAWRPTDEFLANSQSCVSSCCGCSRCFESHCAHGRPIVGWPVEFCDCRTSSGRTTQGGFVDV